MFHEEHSEDETKKNVDSQTSSRNMYNKMMTTTSTVAGIFTHTHTRTKTKTNQHNFFSFFSFNLIWLSSMHAWLPAFVVLFARSKSWNLFAEFNFKKKKKKMAKKWKKTHWNIHARTINGLPEKLMNIRYLMWLITDPLFVWVCVVWFEYNHQHVGCDGTFVRLCVRDFFSAWLVKVNQQSQSSLTLKDSFSKLSNHWSKAWVKMRAKQSKWKYKQMRMHRRRSQEKKKRKRENENKWICNNNRVSRAFDACASFLWPSLGTMLFFSHRRSGGNQISTQKSNDGDDETRLIICNGMRYSACIEGLLCNHLHRRKSKQRSKMGFKVGKSKSKPCNLHTSVCNSCLHDTCACWDIGALQTRSQIDMAIIHHQQKPHFNWFVEIV